MAPLGKLHKKAKGPSLAGQLRCFCLNGRCVTPHLVQNLLEFTFIGSSIDGLKAGLHPFTVTAGNLEHQQTNLETARLYGLLTTGDATISLADLESLSAKEI
jgi:hypothetical protein